MIPPHCLLRPVREDDADALFHLVGSIGHGLTSLPNDPDFLAHRIDDSLRAFDPRVHKPGGEIYLFVLEEIASGRIIGTSGILSRVGGFDPFYTYTIREAVHAFEPLQIRRRLQSLHLTKSHKGPTEICSLFLDREFRNGGLGRLLSLSRFCFMKAFPERFDDEVIAELRGFIDDTNRSPFWEAVGVRFFEKDYYTADILSGLGEKAFIEALMPKFPIYINLLPEDARAVIGKVHPQTEAARRILLNEGFRETEEVDIFDAGPLLKAGMHDLASWKAARPARLIAGDPHPDRAVDAIVTNRSLNFRALLAAIEFTPENGVLVSPEVIGLVSPDGASADALVLTL